MQQTLPPIPHNRSSLSCPTRSAALVALAAALCGGCDGAAVAPTPAPKPQAGVALNLSCPDARFAEAIGPMVRSWEARTGATVTVSPAPMADGDAVDLAVIPAADLGRWAEPGHLAPVPARFRGGEHPFRWFELLPAYADRLTDWGAQTLALPLTGDGFVLAYDEDRYKAAGRPAAPPATWDQFAEVAASFAARDGKPSLPPLPADPVAAFDLFSRVAASYDRAALSDKELEERTKRADAELPAFQYDPQTGRPRLAAPGFRRAADLFAELAAKKALPAGGPDDPVAALRDGRAVLAVLTLDQLSALKDPKTGAVPARFGLAGLPGARRAAEGGADGAPNYIPYFAGGRLGVVRARCPHPDAAFDLLAEIGGPARGAELVATPGLGAGPLRTTHLGADRRGLWLGYGLDEARTKELQEALRHYVGLAVKNPTFGPRGPDRDGLVRAVGPPVRSLGDGAAPAAAVKAAQAAWEELDARAPADALVRWRKRAAGLN